MREKTKKKRGRPKKHSDIYHLHILLDRQLSEALNTFCKENYISKQDLITNLLVDLLENTGFSRRLLTRGREGKYHEFVKWVLAAALSKIRQGYVTIAISQQTLLTFLGKVGLVPHKATLRRYIRKMDAEDICRVKPRGIIIIARPELFGKYLDLNEADWKLVREWTRRRVEASLNKY